MKKRAVFLDRDGVINSYVYNAEFGTVDSPSNPYEFELMPGVPDAIAELTGMGFLVIVVSNQPGIAKGKFTHELLDAMTAKMVKLCGGITAVYYCLHHPKATDALYLADCSCRKPKPGLLLKAGSDWDIDLRASYMVGDGITDVAAGFAAGTRTIFVSPRKCYVCDEMAKHNVTATFITTSLVTAVEIIRSQELPSLVTPRS